MTPLTLLLLACAPNGEPAPTPSGDAPSDERPAGDTAPVDVDGDGWAAGEDCADDDVKIHPGAAEDCDGVDQDCDGAVDDAPRPGADGLATFYADADGDGVGGEATVSGCAAPEGYVAATGDCDDTDASAFPGADEACLDGVDQDCDGEDLLACWTELGPDDAEAWLGNGGTELAVVPDLDGDGHPDLIVAFGGDAAGRDSGGRVYVLPTSGVGELQREDWGLVGSCASESWDGTTFWYRGCEQLGHQVAGLGDTDGDGVTDMLVSGPGWTRDGGAGAVLIVSAPLAAAADADRIVGLVSAGEGAVGLGDTDGDGLGDLALLDGGTLYLRRGPVEGVLSVTELPDRVVGLDRLDDATLHVDGDAAAAGDLDGDGVGDLVVADGRTGTGWIVPGDVTGTVALVDVAVPIGGDAVGYTGRVAGAGDTDGDGTRDVLLGFYQGGVGLFRGPFPTARALADADAAYPDLAPSWAEPWDVASAADGDGDGRDDVLLVADGFVYRVPGALDGARDLAADADVRIEPSSIETGYATATAGDLDGDDVPELIAAGERTWIYDGARLRE